MNRRRFLVDRCRDGLILTATTLVEPSLANPLLSRLKRRQSDMTTNKSNWTYVAGSSNWTMSVVPDGTALIGKTMQLSASATGQDSWKWYPTNSSTTDCEVLMRFKSPSPSSAKLNGPSVCLRATVGSGFDCYKWSYFTGVSGQPKFGIARLDDAVSTALGAVNVTFSSSNWYWMRARVQGSTHYGRLWQYGTAEPGSWNYTTTDATYANGAMGILIATVDFSPFKFDYFSFATGTNTAPMSY